MIAVVRTFVHTPGSAYLRLPAWGRIDFLWATVSPAATWLRVVASSTELIDIDLRILPALGMTRDAIRLDELCPNLKGLDLAAQLPLQVRVDPEEAFLLTARFVR